MTDLHAPRAERGGSTVRIDAASVDAIARRVVELLAEQHRPSSGTLVDAATVARQLGISRAMVYEHADLLGAGRLTDASGGRRPRLRFNLEEATAAWKARSPGEQVVRSGPERTRRRRVSRSAHGSGLLPIRGQDAA